MDLGEPAVAGCAGKQLVSLAAKRQAAASLEQPDPGSARRAGRVLALPRSPKRRQADARDQGELRQRVQALSER